MRKQTCVDFPKMQKRNKGKRADPTNQLSAFIHFSSSRILTMQNKHQEKILIKELNNFLTSYKTTNTEKPCLYLSKRLVYQSHLHTKNPSKNHTPQTKTRQKSQKLLLFRFEYKIKSTSQKQPIRGRKWNLHEMRVFQLPIPAEIVNHRHLPILIVLWGLFRPHFGPLRTHLPVLSHPGFHSHIHKLVKIRTFSATRFWVQLLILFHQKSH